MQLEDLEQSLLAFLSSELIDPELDINPMITFEQLGLQSIELMELIFFAEREFGVQVRPESLTGDNFISVHSFAREILKQIDTNLSA